MYLKRLELKGFKSFADRTVLDFNQGVACVVGPNGSGKSNITDAVRWVLGEQKVKTLRGSKMEDIIFNGTTHRSALGMAEVSLHFDNSNRFFPVDFADVIVTRRIYKSGESEYLLNNTACRLKDVRELFMDTGIGTDGYSIIGQGKIESILSGNGDDRRQVFEEAAGIVKYKAKKKEAVRKLENTELNLVRVEDIAGELKGRIEPLRKESEKAKEHITLSDELKDIEINLFLNDLDKVEGKLKKTEGDYHQQAEIHREAKSKHDQSHEQIKVTENQIFDFENTQNQHKETYRELSEAFRETDGEISVIDERIRSYNNELVRLDLEIKNLNEQRLKNGADLSQQKETQEGMGAQLKTSEADYEKAEIEHQRLSEALKALTEKHEDARNEIIALLNEMERNKSDRKNLMENAQRFDGQRMAMIEELGKIQGHLLDHEEQLKAYQQEIDRLETETAGLKNQINQLETEYKAAKEKGDVIAQNKQTAHVSYEKCKTEHRLLKNMEENMEGFDYSVKNLVGHLKKTNDLKGYIGVVADLIKIPEALETAIDIALGKGLQNIVCEDESVVKRMIEVLKQQKFGRVTFLPVSNLQSNGSVVANEIKASDGFLGVASDLIDYPEGVRPAIEYLLARTLIYKDYDSAAKALRIKQNRLRIVTLDGELLILGGAITGGSIKQKTTGVLNRKSKIDQLEKDMITIQNKITEMDAANEVIQKDLSQSNIRRESLKMNLSSIDRELQEASMLWKSEKLQAEQSEVSVKRIQKDCDGLLEEVEKINERIKAIDTLIEERLVQVEQLEVRMKEGSQAQENLTATYTEVSNAKTNLAVKLAGDREKFESYNREIERLEILIQEEQSGIEEKRIQITKIDGKKNTALEEKEKALLKKIELSEGIEEIKASITNLDGERDKLRQEMQTQEGILSQLALDLEAASHRMHALEIEMTKWTVEKENVVKSIETLYEMTVEEASTLRKPLDEKTVTQRAKQIKTRLKEIGDVNIGSIREYEEVSERYCFLKEQMDDLIKGQNVLKKMIKELDTTMMEQFVETFEAIRQNFGEVFRALFSGGTADLRIVDEENVLESDIEIFAQPPGKKLQSLNLLSGGEKSLTAIALLFSTLKYKPAPFCMLDEIEAALDDVNVYRFAEFLRDFSTDSQFVVITHRKGTMEIADILYGVTMEEYGVSKIVSVKLEDVAI